MGVRATLCRGCERMGDEVSPAKGDFNVEDKQILEIVHQTAAEIMDANDGEVSGAGSVVTTEGGDNLIYRYGFSSIEVLEYLLALEKKFGIALAGGELTEEMLSSATALAGHIAALRRAGASDSGQ